ncbi:MAG: hypothetical protein AMJ69_01345 [Gammaproteobacteria bacterium SG8_47]|nr:MAG: hypothetical protein AMJ69_01345 [Gammaproteobacteria bacterium SG8_47]
MSTQQSEQRHFSRIAFDAPATLVCTDSERAWLSKVLDVSLKGALLVRPSDWQGTRGQHCTLEIKLLGDQVVIGMEVLVAHVEDDHIGFTCHQMDIDSASHLHRLVELNLGDEALLQRELAELVAIIPTATPPQDV